MIWDTTQIRYWVETHICMCRCVCTRAICIAWIITRNYERNVTIIANMSLSIGKIFTASIGVKVNYSLSFTHKNTKHFYKLPTCYRPNFANKYVNCKLRYNSLKISLKQNKQSKSEGNKKCDFDVFSKTYAYLQKFL